MPKRISILGATGSIGTQTLDVIRQFPDRFSVFGLSAGQNIALLKTQIQTFKPKIVVVQSPLQVAPLQEWISSQTISCEVVSGEKGLIRLVTAGETDLVVMAIVGTAALRPTEAAIRAGIPIALACKEVLVAAGDLIMALAREKNVPILPIDSEHAALKQCLAGIAEDRSQIGKLILTASGGPFLHTPKEEFHRITKAQALAHPSWTMGAKITIDSATLMNKGLEVIEAHQLFGVGYSQIEVVIHPRSIVHSLVEFIDGTLLAQMGLPDMRFPIQYALSYPEKWENPWPKTALWEVSPLAFFKPDFDKFPLLKLAFEAGKEGTSAPTVLNAANEAAVALFLEDRLEFHEIPHHVTEALNQFSGRAIPDLDAIVVLDHEVKTAVRSRYVS